jgi:hypothetical protein
MFIGAIEEGINIQMISSETRLDDTKHMELQGCTISSLILTVVSLDQPQSTKRITLSIGTTEWSKVLPRYEYVESSSSSTLLFSICILNLY